MFSFWGPNLTKSTYGKIASHGLFLVTRLSRTRMSPFWISFGAEDDGSGGDNWRYKMCKAPVKMSPTANQHPVFFRLDALPVAQPTMSEH